MAKSDIGWSAGGVHDRGIHFNGFLTDEDDAKFFALSEPQIVQ